MYNTKQEREGGPEGDSNLEKIDKLTPTGHFLLLGVFFVGLVCCHSRESV